ncbi:putative nucleic acid-binding protein [Devosia sp. UYZn731]|uniref:type II toxin-antitoxin system VapC family toxin n=1 Tax=Devosia sp. UYZn731 TaxID=3156345 RepID=UPI00339388EA
MNYLLDTNVLSETRRKSGNAKVQAFVAGLQQSKVHLSVLTLGEIRRGILAKQKADPRFGTQLTEWVAEIERVNAGRIHAVTLDIAYRWGELTSGRTRAGTDALLAATASVHGLTVLTRNVRDFEDFDVPVLNPWDV